MTAALRLGADLALGLLGVAGGTSVPAALRVAAAAGVDGTWPREPDSPRLGTAEPEPERVLRVVVAGTCASRLMSMAVLDLATFLVVVVLFLDMVMDGYFGSTYERTCDREE